LDKPSGRSTFGRLQGKKAERTIKTLFKSMAKIFYEARQNKNEKSLVKG